MRLSRILIGIDFTDGAVAAARWTARDLAPDAELVLAHCAAARGPHLPLPRGAATARLRRLAADLAPARTRVVVRPGDPADGLAALAAEFEADLVVVGPHGSWPDGEEMGSTVERLVTKSRVPVLLAAGAMRGRPQRLLVPVTTGDVSPAVLEWTRALEARSDVRLAVVHVAGWARLPIHPWRVTSSAKRWPRLGDDCEPLGFFVDTAVGPPADVVGQNVERFASDLVVLEGGAASVPGGESLAREMGPFLRQAPCAVLVTAAGRAASDFP